MPLNGLGNFLVPFLLIPQDTFCEYRIKCWPVRIPLTARYLRHVLMLSQMIDKFVTKPFLSKDRLPAYFVPYGLADTPMNELFILLLCFSPFPAELSEHPVGSQARIRLSQAPCSKITRPGILLGRLYYLRPNGIQNNITADFQR